MPQRLGDNGCCFPHFLCLGSLICLLLLLNRFKVFGPCLKTAVKMLVGEAGRAVSSKRLTLTSLISVWVLQSVFQLWSLDPFSFHMERNNLVQTYFYFNV